MSAKFVFYIVSFKNLRWGGSNTVVVAGDSYAKSQQKLLQTFGRH